MANGPDVPSNAGAVIEKLGFGKAQVRFLFLGHGIWFVESMQVGISVVFTVYLASELGWSKSQRALLSSLLFVGITLGSLCGGHFGDVVGRRPPILACYTLAAVAQVLHICTTTFWIIALLRVCVGFAHGLGMPTSIALVSETAPKSYRALLQGCRNVIFGSGSVVAALVVICDDASLKHFHWRVDVIIASLPPVVFLLMAWALLYESPLILAHLGRREEAVESLEEIRRLNGLDGTSLDVQCTSPASEEPAETTSKQSAEADPLKQLKIVCSRKLLPNTVTLSFASISTNLVLYGHMYAFPLITTHLATESSAQAMPPGYQSFLQSVIGVVIVLLIVPLGSAMSRQNILRLGLLIGIVGMMMFSKTAGIQGRSPIQTAMYYFAQNVPSVTAGCAFLGLYQLAVDLYPVEAASTSAAVVVLMGRVGSITAPFIYEAFGHWQVFYDFIAIMCAMSLLMATMLLSPSPPAADDERALAEKGHDLESTPLLAKG